MELLKIEKKCPYCGETQYMNIKSYANHVRWCKKNPKYEEILQNTKEKMHNHRKRKEYTCNCVICNNEYKVYVTPNMYALNKYKQTCSTQCARKLTNAHTNLNQKNQKISKTLSNKCNNIKYTKHVTNTTCTIHATHIHICEYCGKVFESKRRKQKFCSNSCAHNSRYRVENKTLKQLYNNQCKFKFALNSYPKEFDFNQITLYGWYKPKNAGNNLNGVSRDHIFSRNEGYKELIDPYLISHPANCQLMQHGLNASKNIKCDISLDELKNKINIWTQKYGEYPNKINYDIFSKFDIIFKK